jgi:menaquinol-cytochrome c reductase iron-sulfur subunit
MFGEFICPGPSFSVFLVCQAGEQTVALARRPFLRWATAIGAALSGVLVGFPSIRAFLSPAFRSKQGARWIKLGETEQMEQGVPIRFDFSETINDAWVEARALRGVWIYTDDGKSFAVYNGICTHLACSYGFDKEKGIFHCPCHHGLYDPKTGKVLGGPPPRPLDTLETKIENGILYVAYLNFRAGVPEKTPVS